MSCVREMSFIFSLYIILSAFHIHNSVCKEVILKTGTCSEYFERSVEDPDFRTTGWSPKAANDGCSICNSQDTAESWLVTKFQQVKEFIKSVHVNVKVYRPECGLCKNQDVKVYILGKALPIGQKGLKEAVGILKNLTLVTTLKNQKDLTDKFHQFHFEPNAPQLSIAFLSAGSCTLIKDITLSYFVCDKNTSAGVNLPRTVAPDSGSQRVNVSCPENTLNPGNEEAYGLCSSKGIWKIISPCICKKGYTLNTIEEGCIECAVNTYKDTLGNGKCTNCPRNSGRNLKGQSQCMCQDDFYRFQGENYTKPCYGVPSPVGDVKYIDKTETSITLLWTPPPDQGVLYDIECNKCPSGSDSGSCVVPCGRSVMFIPSQNNLTYTNVTIQGLDQDTEYQFVIYSKNMNSARISRTNWKSAVKKIKTEGMSKSDGLPAAVIIVVPVVVIILMIVIIILVVCLLKRRKIRRFRASQRSRGGGDFPLIPGEKNYIDPTTYDNPERAVSEFAKELDRNLIKLEAIIGGGEFGDVYKGDMKLPGQPSMKVAIKTLKAGATRKNRTDFLIEASVMGQFKHINVITLEGVVTKTTPLLIVTEFMENGSLDKYLKENDGVLKAPQLLGLAQGVASGMEYLAGMHFVHRDLAARNVLVNANLACKVADFGLSRDIGNTAESEYETQGGKIPVRWTAPEAITYRKFSTASDIWSYGILLWEIMSFAERPYWNWGNEEVMKRVAEGYRLPPPMNCPKTVHQLMKECWLTDRTKRPAFKEIVRIIEEWIKYPEKLNEDYIKVRRTEPLDYAAFTSIKDWLEAIKMGMYASNFSKAGYEELSDVAQLTEDELLEKVGVRLVGHRHKIYQRIKEMSEDMNLKREQSVRI
ncbi:ephrin type-A receptor 5 isoform X2 [Paramuricea clavata]|uniref:receptor protein-tyrosine kinase n=2 Tax=Paramuricea clavata TaxID=317549 RepID=A0A7D9E721_PARCT|nr:ephrin type-A receptor 5 isoform X2 [Paramuricea clavata]